MSNTSLYLAELEKEIHQVPVEFLPLLLSIVKSYRQSLQLMPAEDSFKQGWEDAKQGDVSPLADLWKDID